MRPTFQQIGEAAYYRWQRRGFEHGRHEVDWLSAEQELLFALNYQLIANHRLDGLPSRFLGREANPRCRFCEGSAPRASFTEPRLVLPRSLGNTSLFSHEICDDCESLHQESVGDHLDEFIKSINQGEGEVKSFEPVAAFKGLARAALAIIPERELQYFEDAIEWVSNTDHDLDSRTIGGLDCFLHALPEPSSFSWIALARRIEADEPFPYLLAFFGTGQHVFQIAMPLCVRDEDLEVSWIVPRASSPFGVGRGPVESRLKIVPLASVARRLKLIAS